MKAIEYTGSCKLMGSYFSIKIMHDNHEKARSIIQNTFAEIARIEDLLSEFRAHSDVFKLNQAAGKYSIRVAQETYELLQRCAQLSKVSNGAFDITVGGIKSLYEFKRNELNFPSSNIVTNQNEGTDYENLEFKHDRKVYLRNPKTKISLAAIGKGYAADMAKKYLMNHGVGSGIVNASGDICAWGLNGMNKPWNIGIPNPEDMHNMLLNIPLFNRSIATSGDAFQYFTSEKKKFSHNIDPKSGKPILGISSVSIIHQSAEVCDALATAVYVLGEKKGINFINKLEGIHAIIINDKNEVSFSEKIDFIF